MDPILVPGPPKEAFKKLRPISDLIKAQVGHFKHLEEKLPAAVRATLPHHPIVSEDDAARYIAAMTALLHSQIAPAAESRAAPTPIRLPARPFPPVAITAGAGKPAAKRRSSARKKASSAKPKTKPLPSGEPK
jgi:hypothetical protein